MIFQIISVATLNNKDKDDDDKNENKIKIFKIIGKNALVYKYDNFINYYREEDCPSGLSSLLYNLLDLQFSLLLRLHHTFHCNRLDLNCNFFLHL